MSCAPGYQPHVKLANGRSSQKLAPNDPHDPTRVPLNCTNSPRLIWTVSLAPKSVGTSMLLIWKIEGQSKLTEFGFSPKGV